MSPSYRMFKSLLLATPFIFGSFSFAQNQAESDGVEEILVTSKKSLSAMKAEMDAAEAEVFDIFNQIYVDTEYEIICRREQVAYSRRSARSCDTRFVRDAEEEALEDQMFDLARAGGGTADDPQGLTNGLSTSNVIAIERHIGELDQKMRELLQTDQEFRQHFNELRDLTTAYQEALEADREQGLWARFFGSSD